MHSHQAQGKRVSAIENERQSMQTIKKHLELSGAFLGSVTEIWRWQQTDLRLEISYYATDALPDLSFVTSVRGIVIHGQNVLVLINEDGIQHIIPGGRVELGETLMDTLTLELLKETGWSFTQPELLGVIHYQHQTPRPEKYSYSYPEFLQVVYTVHAEKHVATTQRMGDYEQEARFISFDEAMTLPIANGQLEYLRKIQQQSSARDIR